MSEWKGKTVLITGASYGIGESFARRLASDGANLVLTARSLDRLETLANELRATHHVNVAVIQSDLAQPTAPTALFQKTEEQGLQIDLLINNAGFGQVGDFPDLPLDRQIEMIQVNVTALTALSHLYLQPMLKRRSGAILNLASTASFQGVPYFSVYAATKAFILILSEGLWAECQPFGVRVIALFRRRSGGDTVPRIPKEKRAHRARVDAASRVDRAGVLDGLRGPRGRPLLREERGHVEESVHVEPRVLAGLRLPSRVTESGAP